MDQGLHREVSREEIPLELYTTIAGLHERLRRWVGSTRRTDTSYG